MTKQCRTGLLAMMFVTGPGGTVAQGPPGVGEHRPQEVRPQFLTLPDWLAPRESMISGIAWYGDDLILLPQQRRVEGRPSIHRGKLYSVARSVLERAVAAPTDEPIPIDVWTLKAPGIDTLVGFEGLEAITFVGDTVFMTVEADVPAGPHGWLLRGRVDVEHQTVRMDPPEVRIMGQSGLPNLTEETLVHYDGEVISIHEANGAGVNPHPVAHAFPIAREFGIPWTGRELQMATVEYRVTDATVADDEGRFWVSNYLWDGDSKLGASDRVFGGPPDGSRAATVPWIERVIELRVTSEEIVPTGRPPIYIEPAAEARNWEGIARLGTQGLLLVSDKFPSTGLAFIPFSMP